MKRARVRLERALRLHLRDECEVKLWGIEAQPCQACENFNDAIRDAIERERAQEESKAHLPADRPQNSIAIPSASPGRDG